MKSFLRNYYQPLILVAVSFVFYWPVFRGLVADWYYDQNFSHGFLIAPISIYLFYTASKKFKENVPARGYGLLIIVMAIILLILGTAGSEYFTTRFSFVIYLLGIAVFALGVNNAKIAWFPFFFLLFMIPIPNIIYTSMTMPLQLFASKATVFFLNIISIPSDLAGNIIYLPGYSLEVAEACSGLRSLFSLFALSFLVGYLFLRGFWQILILALAAVPIAIAANVLRVLLIAILAYLYSPAVAEGFLHQFSGLFVFVIAMAMVLTAKGLVAWTARRFGF